MHELSNLHLSTNDIQRYIDSAYKSFTCVKKEPLRQDTWIAGLITAQADATNKPKRALWKQLHTTEQARETARAVCSALCDQWRTPRLLVVIGPAFHGGGQQEFTNKADLKWACLDKAGRRFTQASDTPF